MANFKVVVSDPKSRKAYQKEVDQSQSGLMGRKIGDKLAADSLGLPGYEIEITGGSDKDGFPMRKDVEGIGRKKIILAFGPGYHPKKKGIRKRKSVRGNTISSACSQINLKVVKYGTKGLAELFGKAEGKAEKPKEGVKKPEKAVEKKEEAKAEEKKVEKTVEKPAEEKKEAQEVKQPEQPAVEEKKEEVEEPPKEEVRTEGGERA